MVEGGVGLKAWGGFIGKLDGRVNDDEGSTIRRIKERESNVNILVGEANAIQKFLM
jgi:hypothetical protein